MSYDTPLRPRFPPFLGRGLPDGQWYYGTPGSGWSWFCGPDGQWHIVFRIRIGGGS
jgi:hypothetical protein